MHFLKALFAGAALIASTAAQGKLAFTSFPSDVEAGTPVKVTWAGGDKSDPVTIKLRKGSSKDLKDVAVLTSSATGGSYTWTPSSSLTDGSDYALEISQGDEVNYTNQFPISGGSGSASPSSHTASETTSETASTAASTSASETTTTDKDTTTTPPPTTSMLGTASRGTVSTSIARNTTFSVPTLTSSLVVTRSATASPTESDQAPSASPTGNSAASLFVSPLSLVLGALGAFMYFQ